MLVKSGVVREAAKSGKGEGEKGRRGEEVETTSNHRCTTKM